MSQKLEQDKSRIIPAESRFVTLIVCETIDDTSAQQYLNLVKTSLRPALNDCEDFVDLRVLVEDSSHLIVIETEWANQGAASMFQSSRPYRQFTAAVSHLLIGDPVTKLMKREVGI